MVIIVMLERLLTSPTRSVDTSLRIFLGKAGTSEALRKGFGIKMNDYIEYTAMECLDITVKAGNESLRLVSIY